MHPNSGLFPLLLWFLHFIAGFIFFVEEINKITGDYLVKILDNAVAPKNPVPNKTVQIIAIGFFIGLGISSIIIYFIERLKSYQRLA